MLKVLFLDIETTGLSETSIVWQTVYAKALQEEGSLRLLEVREFVGKECIRHHLVKEALEWADFLVAHNVRFELSFLFHRELPCPDEVYCTMLSSTDVCKIVRRFYDYEEQEYRYSYKWPKLSEAVNILGLRDTLLQLAEGDFHDSIFDIYATILLYAYLEGIKLDADGHTKITSSLLKKCVIAGRYAVPKYKDGVLRSLENKSIFCKAVRQAIMWWERFRR